MQQNFDAVLKRVLAHEGGYCNDANDPGGPTNWGITIWDARKYWKRDATADDVRAMPRSVAERIYKSKYWDAMRCDELPSGVDYAVFDFGVNSGTSRSLKFLEEVAGVPVDGKPDDQLIRTVASLPPKPVITELCNRRLVFLKSLSTWDSFGRGWGRRVAEVKAAALDMASNVQPAPLPKPVETPKTEKPDTAQKPAVQSKTVWASISTILASIGGLLAADWHVVAVVAVAILAGFIIWDRMGKPDISGVLK